MGNKLLVRNISLEHKGSDGIVNQGWTGTEQRDKKDKKFIVFWRTGGILEKSEESERYQR